VSIAVPMTASGLGCVKMLHRKCRGVAILADCRVGAFFGFDYALIAAMSGWASGGVVSVAGQHLTTVNRAGAFGGLA
jgi:hypothetical protein